MSTAGSHPATAATTATLDNWQTAGLSLLVMARFFPKLQQARRAAAARKCVPNLGNLKDPLMVPVGVDVSVDALSRACAASATASSSPLSKHSINSHQRHHSTIAAAAACTIDEEEEEQHSGDSDDDDDDDNDIGGGGGGHVDPAAGMCEAVDHEADAEELEEDADAAASVAAAAGAAAAGDAVSDDVTGTSMAAVAPPHADAALNSRLFLSAGFPAEMDIDAVLDVQVRSVVRCVPFRSCLLYTSPSPRDRG